MNRIVLSSTIETDASEEQVFKEWKQWMYEQFRVFRLEVTGKDKTLKLDTKEKSKWMIKKLNV